MEDLEIILLRPGPDLDAAEDDIWTVLERVDREFVPPLSARTDTMGQELTKESIWGGPISYYETLMKQYVLLARAESRTVGLMSFVPHWTEPLLDEWSPSTYVSTTGTLASFRHRGVASALNDAVETLPADLESNWITRTTWSSNVAYIRLLKGRGFHLVRTLPDHRGPGIDTLYWARRTHVA